MTSVSECPRNAGAASWPAQFPAQSLEVVDLAVEGDDVALRGGDHRLMPRRRKVHDREPPEPQGDPGSGVRPFPAVVRAAVVQRARPSASRSGTESASVLRADVSQNPVKPHISSLPSCSPFLVQPPVAGARSTWMSKCVSTRRRARAPSRRRSSSPMSNSRARPPPAPAGSRRGTTRPVSPTSRAESPTSVTAHGTPQAIASPTVFGKPFPGGRGSRDVQGRRQVRACPPAAPAGGSGHPGRPR